MFKLSFTLNPARERPNDQLNAVAGYILIFCTWKVYLQVYRCVRKGSLSSPPLTFYDNLGPDEANSIYSVQVNIPAESGEMGVLANHVPSIEQLKPGLVEIIEESGGSKQFFRKPTPRYQFSAATPRILVLLPFSRADSRLCYNFFREFGLTSGFCI